MQEGPARYKAICTARLRAAEGATRLWKGMGEELGTGEEKGLGIAVGIAMHCPLQGGGVGPALQGGWRNGTKEGRAFPAAAWAGLAGVRTQGTPGLPDSLLPSRNALIKMSCPERDLVWVKNQPMGRKQATLKGELKFGSELLVEFVEELSWMLS